MLSRNLVLAALWLAATLAATAQSNNAAPVLKASATRASAIYKQGEQVVFKVELAGQSSSESAFEVFWKISKDGVPPVQSGKTPLVNGKAEITASLKEPGHLLCAVTFTNNGKPLTALAGAAIDPLLIKPSLPVPDDFDAFWNEQKKQLAAVPLNARLTPVKTSTGKDYECFDVQADCVGDAPVSGYYVRPAGAQPKSLPAILLLHGAGVNSSSLAGASSWAERGFLAMDINAHGLPNGKSAEFYKDLMEGKLKGYSHFGRESRETIYFLGMFLRVARALDVLASQPEWDGKTIIAYGSSQGGFQALAAGYLDPRVSFVAAGVPAGCDHTGVMAGRVNGWPKIVPNGPDGKPDPKILQAARYFDNVNFAARTKAKAAFFTVGFIDQTCPATTVYAAYNALPIPKDIFNDIPTGHANSPEATRARNQAVTSYVNRSK